MSCHAPSPRTSLDRLTGPNMLGNLAARRSGDPAGDTAAMKRTKRAQGANRIRRGTRGPTWSVSPDDWAQNAERS